MTESVLRKPSPEGAKKPQIDCFKESAHQLGCDEDEAAFKAKLAMIARQKPKVAPSEESPKKEINA